ncbi:hypothetical protein [Methylocella sp.]|uniref:hypothetical protein n=1 Tax=Methylocella sp. TaxID=1978226 RepID=UPI0037842E42
MAGLGRGIGSFLDGFANGAKLRQSFDDAAWQEKARARQEVEQRQADEDRAANKAWNEKARAQQEKAWSQADEDRALRRQNELANAGWLANERARQQGQWGREDALRQAQDDAYSAGQVEREKAIGKSIFPAPTQGPTLTGEGSLPDGYRVGSRYFDTKEQAREEAERAAGSVYSYINGDHADKVTKEALAAGDKQLAQSYRPWLADQQVQAGAKHFSDAIGKWSTGDAEGAVDSLAAAYNQPGYMDNGYKVAPSNIIRDESGKPVSVDLEFSQGDTGQRHVEKGVSLDDLFKKAPAFLAPDNVIKFGLEKIKAEQEAAKAGDTDRRALALDLAKKRGEMMLKREEQGSGNPYANGTFNEGQGKAASFADRMAQAEDAIRRSEGINSGVTGGAGGLINEGLPAAAANVVAGKDRQEFNQGARAFINGLLRRESGAAISESEFANYRRQFLPQPGDDAGVIAQKRADRVAAIRGMMREAGPSYKPPRGWENPDEAGGSAPAPAAPKAASGPDRPAIASAADAGARIARARAAIAAGANPAVVAERLRGMGIDPGSLRQ